MIQPLEFTREYEEDERESVRFLRAANILDGELRLEPVLYVAKEKVAKAQDSRIEVGDVLITRTGANAGATCAVRDLPDAYYISSHTIRLILRREMVEPKYLESFLISDFGKSSVERLFTGAAQKQLQLASLSTLPIAVPSLPDQRKMVEEMERARESRRRKREEADDLLSGLDAFLLDRLGLATKRNQHPRFYGVRLRDAWGRCDPDFHSPGFKALRKSIEDCGFPVLTVGEICSSVKSGFAAGREMQAFDDVQGVPHIRPLNISSHGELTFEGTKYVPKDGITENEIVQGGEVLLNNTNSTEWVGKSTVFETDGRCCCSNHITRLVIKPGTALPWYIASFFNAIRSTGYLGLLATNFVNQAGINTETLSALRLPVPDPRTQQEIVDELHRRRLEARRLRGEAAREWEKAKARFEAKLLGG
jgi:type I restriction enzyme S subunit